jgi:hypothetical protein
LRRTGVHRGSRLHDRVLPIVGEQRRARACYCLRAQAPLPLARQSRAIIFAPRGTDESRDRQQLQARDRAAHRRPRPYEPPICPGERGRRLTRLRDPRGPAHNHSDQDHSTAVLPREVFGRPGAPGSLRAIASANHPTPAILEQAGGLMRRTRVSARARHPRGSIIDSASAEHDQWHGHTDDFTQADLVTLCRVAVPMTSEIRTRLNGLDVSMSRAGMAY